MIKSKAVYSATLSIKFCRVLEKFPQNSYSIFIDLFVVFNSIKFSATVQKHSFFFLSSVLSSDRFAEFKLHRTVLERSLLEREKKYPGAYFP